MQLLLKYLRFGVAVCVTNVVLYILTKSFSKIERGSPCIADSGRRKHTRGGEVPFFTDDQYFADPLKANAEPLITWTHANNTKRFCDGKLKVYANQFVEIHDVLLFPSKRDHSKATGGEHVPYIFGARFKTEYYCFHNNFMEINCSKYARLPTSKNQFIWLNYIQFNIDAVAADALKHDTVGNMVYEDNYTIAIRRQDYWNLHNVLRNMYNAFLLAVYFKVAPTDIKVLLMDGHPFTNLDLTWHTVFRSVVYIGHLKTPILYKNLIFGILENKGPLIDYQLEHMPYLEEFRMFMLKQHNLTSEAKLNCKQFKITLIIRRNALFSPVNNEHKVGRKIANELEIVLALMDKFRDARVQPVLLDALPMSSQLAIVSNTDILIGMHGAGMSHVMFLLKHAAVIELFPKEFKTGRPWFVCYSAIAKWRGLIYDTWENFNTRLEMPYDYTIIPTDIVTDKVITLKTNMCYAR